MSKKITEKIRKRKKRHQSIRKQVIGTADKPRLCVFKSLNHIYAQAIDDAKGLTIVAASSMDKSFKDTKGHTGNVATAKKVGELIGKRMVEKKINQVVFDRGGNLYHGRVKALADAARKAGLEF